MPSFASDNNLLVVTTVTTPRQPKKKKALFIDYTPMNVVEKEDYKFYCQFCCMYFREILQTACCSHYSCYACSLTYCAGRCGLKSSLSGIPRELPAAMPCLACSKEGLTLAYVSFHEKVRSYADSPATRRAMEDAERAKRKAEGGLPTIDGSPNLAPCRDAEGEGGAAADEATPGKALSFDAIELGGGGRRRGDDGASPTGVDSGVSSAATSVSTSPAPSDGGDPTGAAAAAFDETAPRVADRGLDAVGAVVTVPTPRPLAAFSNPTPGRPGEPPLALALADTVFGVTPRGGTEFHAYAQRVVNEVFTRRFVRAV
jgi:hypothetical protein